LSDIGVKLGVEGESEFKNALKQINTNLKTLGTEMKSVTSAFDRNDTSVENLSAQNKVLNKQIDEQKSKLEMLKAKLAESAKEYGENDAKTQKWQQQVNLATAALNKSELQLKNNNKALEEASKESKSAGDETEKAGKQAKKSGEDAEKGESGWSKLGGGLAKAGEHAAKAMAALGAAASAVGAALVGASVSGAAYADELLTMAQVTGLTTDQVQEFKYMQELVDVSMETMTKSMTRNVKSMGDAARGSKTAEEAYAKLGVAVTDADGALRDGNTVYYEVIDALGKMENETERDALAMQVLGKSARDLVPLIEAGSEELNELRQQAHDAGYVLSGDALDAFGAFDDQLQYLKVGATAAKNALGTILLPMLTEFAGEGVDLLAEFTTGIQDANGDMEAIGDSIGTTLASFINKIVERLPQIMEAGLSIISALGRGLIDNLPMIVSAAVDIIKMMANSLIKLLPEILSAAFVIIATLAEGIVDSLPELIPAIVETVLMIVETLIDNIDLLADAYIAIMVALADGLIEALPKLLEKVPEIIIKLVQAIANNLPKIIEAGIGIIIALAGALIQAIPQLVEKIPEIITAIVEAFESFKAKIKEIGENIVKGVWEGIKSMAKWIKDKVSDFFGGVVDGVKGVLGIKSPSRVFAGIGENMAAGLGVGFAEQMKSVQKQINESVPTRFSANATVTATTRAMEGAVNGMAALMGNSGGTYVIQTVLDGRVIAETIFDPLKSVSRQKGVALA
jgi:predicted PurR-regulated permease PerM/methyl-accepting chemotaxis protein